MGLTNHGTQKFESRRGKYIDRAVPNIAFIVDKILKEDPSAKLHLTTFGDYPTVENLNANATYCYRFELTTSNKEAFLAAVNNVDSTYGGRDIYESSLTALLYTATEPKIKWSSKNTKRVIKIIAIASDAFWKSSSEIPSSAGPEYMYPLGPIGGYGDCSHRPPRINDVFATLANENFYLLPIVYGGKTFKQWNNTLTLLPVLRDKYYMEDEPPGDLNNLRKTLNFWANEGHDERFQVKIYRMSNEYENFRSHITPQMGYRWKGLGKRIENIYTLWGLGPLPGVPEAEQYF
ncbi:hypothetical protein Fcan01_23199 [Folsomia candida]|uniref:Uncharacterized protein n=1 Tax=Folsomia candida TaxID=158441 RepID=A0A226DB39_FOLCA|nr:hypothetical protein Fcan01_23199 [Folsomia candida]